MEKLKLKDNKGQTLVEVVVGLALAILVLGALINVVITALYNSNFAKSQAESTKLAQQLMERVRIQRDTLGYLEFSSRYGNGLCYWYNASNSTIDKIGADGGCSVYQDLNPTFTSSTKFKHLIKITTDPLLCPLNCSEIQVSVYWADSNCPNNDFYCHKSQVNSYLTKW